MGRHWSGRWGFGFTPTPSKQPWCKPLRITGAWNAGNLRDCRLEWMAITTTSPLTPWRTMCPISCSLVNETVWNCMKAGWWFGTLFIFPNSWDDDPIWLSYFSGGWLNHQLERASNVAAPVFPVFLQTFPPTGRDGRDNSWRHISMQCPSFKPAMLCNMSNYNCPNSSPIILGYCQVIRLNHLYWFDPSKTLRISMVLTAKYMGFPMGFPFVLFLDYSNRCQDNIALSPAELNEMAMAMERVGHIYI